MSGSGQVPCGLLRLCNVGKTFGFTRVLQGVDLDLARGETIALLGENGAGKSTLSKIISGVIRPDDGGEMTLEGTSVAFQAPRDALAHGIALIPQELAYVPHLSIADNVMLNRWTGRLGVVTHRSTRQAAERAAAGIGVDLGDVSRPMVRLTLAERQIVEIVKALSRQARIIVLDEPTAALSQEESRRLFDVVGRLNRDGVGIIYVSHRMDEVYEFSRRVVVLRNGRKVADLATAGTSKSELIRHMLGHDQHGKRARIASVTSSKAATLVVSNWSRRGIPSLAGVSFTVAANEIVCLYGLRGSGAELVAQGLGGARSDISGAFSLHGRDGPIPSTPIQARKLGVGYVPAERKREGLVLKRSIRENLVSLVLPHMSRFGVVRVGFERRWASEIGKRFDVRYRRLDQPVSQLSGGNQQKILLASRMAMAPSFLVLQEPSRGVDVGARAQIHSFLRDIARTKCPMVVVTSDIEEAVELSDRLIVIREGRVAGELSGGAKTQAAAAALAAGGI
ncbi:sugar ABC transporter ATP-binding protein [Bradyrhizobium sp. CCBAU 51753]|uniref:sugar ABC transporter ATP-binding protein n=1 Tax=Bradyrhizobium sp. CCBAU 51753 TaxID=1325100 RepID=UPI00188CC94A|nr:sugar ABC transporter ATP-binding protein [Bradyrhizobium sp. CCBAU 51753]